MPELPEVETVCRDLRSCGLIGKPITQATVLWDRTIQNSTTETFCHSVQGKRIIDIRRRGKYIHILLSDSLHVFIHLRMTGSLSLVSSEMTIGQYDRVIITFNEFSLRFSDPRKFGRIMLCDSQTSIYDKLGPDPFDPLLTTDVWFERLHGRQMRIKPLLLDQSFLAGLGNIYADESLFSASIHPCRPAHSLSRDESAVLLESIRHILTTAIIHRGTSLGDGKGNFTSNGDRGENISNLRVYGKSTRPCPKCSTPIQRIVVGQRGTHYCPNCQK
ncbi:MAG: DNA-formamidopyrimidine glycosylase [Sphaerochaetaceae bacterium]